MLSPDLIDVPIEVFGGYCPAIPPSNLPPGAASVAQDVEFPQGAVRSRGGLQSVYPNGIAAGASIMGMHSYITPTLAIRLMAWDNLGNLYKENPQGTINLINSRPYQGLFYQAQSQFSREYEAFFNSVGGFDIPRQYDDTNWDRVSQVGPGQAPVASDLSPSSFTIAAAGVPGLGVTSQGYGITSATESGNVVTLRLGTGLNANVAAGDTVIVAGVGVAGYNGTFTVTSASGTVLQYYNPTASLASSFGGTATTYVVLLQVTTLANFPNGSQVTIAGAANAAYNGVYTVRIGGPGTVFSLGPVTNTALANSGAGTAQPLGDISAGLHGVSVAFITRQGFITQPAPPNFWTAVGGKYGSITNIVTGPPNVVARLLLFTPVIIAPAMTGTFYSLPQGSTQFPAGAAMLIPDNTTESLVVDFSDTVLIAGFNAEYLFTQLELGECAWTGGYNARTAWMGERARVPNFLNLSFDGGFDTITDEIPNGWTRQSAGGSSAVADGITPDWGDAYVITGDGVAAVKGKIVQSAYQDFLLTPIIAQNTSYGVRARVRSAGGLTQGTLNINLQSTIGAFTTPGLQVTAAQANANPGIFVEYIAALTSAPLVSPPTDLLLQVFVDGTPNNGGQFVVDSIEVYPANAPFNYSVGRFSHAFNPESFDSITGQVQVRPGDGQQLRAGFPMRGNFYLAKDHYLGYVTDDGVNEPASWAFNEVSATVGICGPNAVDWNEEWAVFAERSGFYICWGSDPVKISPEIQYDASNTGKISWASINWQYGYTIWVRIDRVAKKILIGAPVNGAVQPNVVFMLDYQWLMDAQDIASSPMVTYSAFTGKILAHGRGRRWAIWNISANSMTFAERANGTAVPFFGNNKNNSKIYQQLAPSLQASDDGVAIASNWVGAGSPSHQEEQQYQLGAHRKLCGYMKFRATGAGNLNLSVGTTLRTTILRPYALNTGAIADGARPLNIHGERFYPGFGTSAVGSWFQVEQLILSMKKDATIVVAGTGP